MSQSERRRQNIADQEAGRLPVPTLKAELDQLRNELQTRSMLFMTRSGGRLPTELAGLSTPHQMVMAKKIDMLAEYVLPDERDRLAWDIAFHRWMLDCLSDERLEQAEAEARQATLIEGVAPTNGEVPPGLQAVEGFARDEG